MRPHNYTVLSTACLSGAACFQNWAYTLLLHVPPIASTDVSGYVLNFAEKMSVYLFSILMPFVLFVFIGFVLTIIHEFLVQEWIFAYFGKHLEIVQAMKHIVSEQWYVRRHGGSDDSSLVALLCLAANSDAYKHELTGMEQIEENMKHTEDLTLDDIREVLRLMQQEGMFDKKQHSSTPPLDDGEASTAVTVAMQTVCSHSCAVAPIVCKDHTRLQDFRSCGPRPPVSLTTHWCPPCLLNMTAVAQALITMIARCCTVQVTPSAAFFTKSAESLQPRAWQLPMHT